MKSEHNLHSEIISGLLLYALIVLLYFLYLPGLTGGFIFDDYANLERLNLIRNDSSPLADYLSLSNRPVSFLTFLLNDNAWPSLPEGFLLTNLQFHLLATVLLFWFFFCLAGSIGLNGTRALRLTLLATAIWALHPLFVSTVLFTVQRMTILSAIFVLASLIVYLKGRAMLVSGSRMGLFLLYVLLPAFGALGLFSKENAALLPLYLLVLEYCLLGASKADCRPLKVWRVLAVWIPSAVLLASVFVFYDFWSAFYIVREFNLSERLMTESRVIMEYLGLIFLPRASTNGLHYENYQVSTGLLEPASTLISMAALSIASLYLIVFRNRFRVLATAVLFYLCGHLLESTFYPLELYYEHRNYLPSIMLFFALAWYLQQYLKPKYCVFVSVLVCLFLGFLTHARAGLWGNQLLLYSVWIENNPGSRRTYAEASVLANRLGNPVLSYEFLKRGVEAVPESPILQLGYIGYGCRYNLTSQADIDRTARLLTETRELNKHYVFKNIEILLRVYRKGLCRDLGFEEISTLIEGALANPLMSAFPLRKQEVLHSYGLAHLYDDNQRRARELFQESFDAYPQLQVAARQIAILASEGHYTVALEYVQYIKEKIDLQLEAGQPAPGASDILELESRLVKSIESESEVSGPVE